MMITKQRKLCIGARSCCFSNDWTHWYSGAGGSGVCVSEVGVWGKFTSHRKVRVAYVEIQ